MMHVNNLDSAYAAYWAATSFREQQAAHNEILLFAGQDGYRDGWRFWLARFLRKMALWIERGAA